MNRVWEKIILAVLFLLGEAAFASEGGVRTGDTYELDCCVVQQSQSELIDDTGYVWQPARTAINIIHAQASLAYHSSQKDDSPITGLPDYHSLYPRAPPVTEK